MSSIHIPLVFTAANCPPITLALPGPITAVVTPASIADWNPPSKGFIPSIALICGVIGSLASLVPFPAPLFPSSCSPK